MGELTQSSVFVTAFQSKATSYTVAVGKMAAQKSQQQTANLILTTLHNLMGKKLPEAVYVDEKINCRVPSFKEVLKLERI